MESTVTTKNMTSIPVAVARATGIQPGWKLDWILGDKNDEILLKVIPGRAERARQLFGKGKRREGDESPVAGLVRERDQENQG